MTTVLSRRRFLQTALVQGACLSVPVAIFGQAPAIGVRDRVRPDAPSGLQIGDVLRDRAIIWSRTNRPARLIVERAFREDFRDGVRITGPIARADNDYTARLDLTGLPSNQQVFVRVTFENLESRRAASAPLTGQFRTAPSRPRDIRFVWSGDVAGQGFGINPEWGGMRSYEAMRRVQPDFFIHSGDTIYADGPIPATITLDDGSVWKNVVTDAVGKVAESLREYHGRFSYNLLDDNVRRFAAEVPQLWQWDDHEVLNNWSDAKDLSEDSRYTEKNIRVLAERARRAFLDYAPMRAHRPDDLNRIYRRIPHGPLLEVFMLDQRSYRGPNSYNRQARPGADTAFMGAAQLTWLKESLAQSTAVWKVVASDMPICLLVPDGQDGQRRDMSEAVANGDGPVLGREFEFADLFRFIKEHRVHNIVWLTADVHYTAAHHYHPDRAQFRDFEPFWEFVSGPLNAGSFGPNPLDNTFGPLPVFQKAPPTPNAPPSAGYQFFGQVDVEAATSALTVTLKDVSGASLFVQRLEPVRR